MLYCNAATPVVIRGAKTDSLNGVYDPVIDAIHCDLPVYVKRNSKDFILIFNSEINECSLKIIPPGEWVILNSSHYSQELLDSSILVSCRKNAFKRFFDINSSYVRINCNPAVLPDMRVEGKYGISEFTVMNSEFILVDSSSIEIISESFLLALDQTESLKREYEASR